MRYLIFVRLKPSDIDESFTAATDGSFKRLLQFNMDVMTSVKIDADDVAHANEAAQVEPKYERTVPWTWVPRAAASAK